MGLNIGTNSLNFNISSTNGSVLDFGPALDVQASTGYVGSPTGSGALPGFGGYKNNGTTYWTNAYDGWDVNAFLFNNGFNITGRYFLVPVSGTYVFGFYGIVQGYGADDTFGYAGFSKNNVLVSFTHWNMATNNGWVCAGHTSAFECQSNDLIRLHINNLPASDRPTARNNNKGLYPSGHHSVWGMMIA